MKTESFGADLGDWKGWRERVAELVVWVEEWRAEELKNRLMNGAFECFCWWVRMVVGEKALVDLRERRESIAVTVMRKINPVQCINTQWLV